MKKILKKNQVIITALVIMIAVAGYLNFTQDKVNTMADKDGSVQTGADAGEAGKDLAAADEGDGLASLTVDSEGNEVVDAENKDSDLLDLSAEDLGEDDTAAADSKEVAQADKDDTGEAVLVSNMINGGYFESAKLTREQTRAKNKEMLMELVDDKNISEAQKQEAINNIINMTAIAEKEGAAEILLGAKGFEDVVVSMMDGSVDVIVNADNLTEQQMAQIEDIVKRKTGVSAENIVITPVGVKGGE